MSLFRCSSGALLASAAAAASSSSSAAVRFSLLSSKSSSIRAATGSTSRSSVSSRPSSLRSFSTGRPSTYPRSRVAQPSHQPTGPPTSTLSLEPEPEPLLAEEVEAEGGAVEPRRKVELPAEMSPEQEIGFEQVLSRNKIQKYNKTHIHLRHLPHGVTNADLKSALEGAGLRIANARILAYPRRDGRFVSRGYGWATLEDERDMRNALRLNGMKIDGVPIEIEQMKQRPHGSFDRPPKPKPEQEPGYYLRLPPRARPHERLFGFVPDGGERRIRAKQLKQGGPRPGQRERDVDWSGWQGRRTAVEEAEVVPSSSERQEGGWRK